MADSETDTNQKIVRWGILGTARIAAKVGPAIRLAQATSLSSIASRDAQRAADWATQHGVERSCGSYQELLEDPDIDAVYIPLPPSMHHEWTLRAAEHGKHVLCEKPLAMSSSEANEMAAACREHRVQLMDGVMWLHHPRTADMHRPITEGTLGQLRRITSSFTFCWDELPKNEFRLLREFGGGSLFDLGWYCVGASLWAFGELPQRVYGTARYRNDVDMSFSGIMWFDGDRMASFDSGFDTGLRKWFEVAGTKASLVCDDFTKPHEATKPRFWMHGREGQVSEHFSEPRIQEVSMIEDFSNIVRSGQLDDRWFDCTLATQRVCEALDQSARSEKVVELT